MTDYLATLAAAALNAPVAQIADAVKALEEEGRYYMQHSIKGWDAARAADEGRREVEHGARWMQRDLDRAHETANTLRDCLDSAQREVATLRAMLAERDSQLRAARRRLLDAHGGDSLARRALAAEVLWDAARAGAGWEVAAEEYAAVVGDSDYPAE